MASGYPDFEGNKSGMYLIPYWAAKESKDKSFVAALLNAVFGNDATTSYTVPAGKNLYVVGASGLIRVAAAANYDHFLYCMGTIRNDTDAVNYATTGGVGGFLIILNAPVIIPGGDTFKASIVNYSDLTVNLTVQAWGYEL